MKLLNKKYNIKISKANHANAMHNELHRKNDHEVNKYMQRVHRKRAFDVMMETHSSKPPEKKKVAIKSIVKIYMAQAT